MAGADHRSFNPYGYIARTVPPAWSMIANHLSGTNNTVRSLFRAVPEETQIWKINETTGVDEQALFSGGAWSGPNFTLLAGEGAKIYNPDPTPFSITFVGEVLQGYLVNPIPAGLTRRSSSVPQSGGVTSLLLYPPSNGDQFQRLTSGGTPFTVSTYATSVWSPAEPVPAMGEGFLIYNNSGAAKNWSRTFFVWP